MSIAGSALFSQYWRCVHGSFQTRFSATFRCSRQRDSAGGLIGSGVNLGPRGRPGARTPNQGRQGDAERLPLLLGRLRHTDSHHRRQDRQHRRRSAQPAQRRARSAPRARRSSSSTSTPTVRPRFCIAPRARPIGRYGTSSARWTAIAELVKKTRDETFIEKLANGKLVNMTPAIFALGGATLEIEFNHIYAKNSCAVWASSPSRIRHGYDTALASPVWGPDSAAAQRPFIPGAWPTPTASSSWAPIWRRTIPSLSAGR